MPVKYIVPQEGPQKAFLESDAQVVVYGGAKTVVPLKKTCLIAGNSR